MPIEKITPNLEKQLEIAARGDVLLYNKLGGIGDILCARLIFEDMKKMPNIGNVTFAVPRKYLSLIEDHPFIDRKMAVEDINDEVIAGYVFSKDLTQTPGQAEYRTMPNAVRNRSDILAESIGLSLKSHQGHLTFSDREMEFAGQYIKRLGD
ncbi:unnamed protein product, partial [marine sediment metagenome]